MPKFTLKDTRGKESTTLSFVVVAFVVVVIKFLLASLTIFGVEFPDMTGSEFGLAIGAVLAIWQYRETKAKSVEFQHAVA